MILLSLSSYVQPVEIIGILAGVIVLSSFLLKGEIKIRLLNIVGAVLFVVYGLLVKSLSVWLINFLLVIVHVIFILKRKGDKNEIK